MSLVKEVEPKIRKSIKAVLKKGWCINRYLTTCFDGKQCCALGAVAVQCSTRKFINAADGIHVAARALGITVNEADEIACGFDSRLNEKMPTKWMRLGNRLAKEYVK